MAKKQKTSAIVKLVSDNFRTFGGGKGGNGFNPLAEALKDKEPQFAAGVDVREVVEFVLSASKELDQQPQNN